MYLHAPNHYMKMFFHSWFSLSLLDIPYAKYELNCLNFNSFNKSIKRIILIKYKDFWAHFRCNDIDG